MGIEKYFTASGSGSSRSAKLKKAEPAKKATPTRKRKAPTTTEEDNDDNDDFQKPIEKKIDPASFFGKASAKKAATTSAAATKKIVEQPPVEPTKKQKEETKNPIPKPTAKKATTSTPKPTAKKEAASTSKTPARKARAKAIVLSDSEDDFVDKDEVNDEDDFEDKDEVEEEEDYVDDSPPQKKPKRATSFNEESTKKAPVKKAPVKKPTTPATKKTTVEETKVEEQVEEEKPKKKSNFYAMKNTEAPKALGTRPEPVGAENCLANLTFVQTGQYETITREKAKDVICRYGGRVTGSVSGRTDYLCVGRDAGESKLAKAKTLGTKILDEDAFYHLVESSAPKKVVFAPPPPPLKGKQKASDTVATQSKESNVTQLWTEKYKPTKIEEIIGNKDLVKKISEWLENWQTNYAKGFEGEGDIFNYGALLLSGPPGIGKTTTAQVVAVNNGYEPLEFNASDVRSKKVLEASITEMMDNRTMTEFFQPASKKPVEPKLLQGKKVVLIMDEVDGMSGGDRGGGAELASLIRKSKIPVICICNDPRSPKVAPLLRVCFEAKYKRTPAAQIRSRILSIAFKEGLSMTPNAVDELVAATHNDIRQVINILSTYRLKEGSMTYDQAKAVGKNNEKYSILGLFDIPIELLSTGAYTSKTLNEKADVYFHDYSLAHLMIFENYLRCTPTRVNSMQGNTSCNEMDLVAQAAEAMADGDLVDGMIHGTVQHYSLMPVHSIFSCVRPASFMRGSIRQKMMFPSWLGQNSKAGKYARALSDIQTRMRLKASGDKFEIRQNYIPTLNDRLFGSLQEENYDEAMDYMDNYYLDRENLDILSDLTFSEPKQKGPITLLPTKTKSTFTRMYNAKNHPILFQLSGDPIKKAVSGPKEDAEGTLVEEEAFGEEEVPEEDELDKEDDPERDIQSIKYIKESTKKRKATTAASSSNKKQKSKK